MDEVCAALETGPEGLSPAEGASRLHRHGANAFGTIDQRSHLEILVSQVANLPMGLLLGSAGFAAVTGEAVEATAILVVVGMNAAIGYRIERKNQEILSSWSRLEAGLTEVIRGGNVLALPAVELVPGDVILCGAGDILPADARVIDADRLSCDEAALTGESAAQRKGPDPAPADAPLADRSSMLYAGTVVSTGHARAVVVATGAGTELARVRRLVEEERAPVPPLTRRLEHLGNQLAAISLGAAGVAAVSGLARGHGVARVLNGAVALGVAAVPEGLPLVATAALVRSMQRLHRQGMVVRRLAAAEALGTVSVICADKTGTLTRNEMRLECVDLGDGTLEPSALRADPDRILEDPLTSLLAAAVLNSDVDVHRRGGSGGELQVLGSPTERALVLAAHAAGLDSEWLQRRFPRLELRGRTESSRYVVSLHEAPDGGRIAFLKGAPGQVIELCDARGEEALVDAERERLEERNDRLASSGLRVLALGWRRLDPDGDWDGDGGFRFLGFVGLRDPLRSGAAEAIRSARDAGIRTLILTGDQPRTAEAIADELGLEGGALLASDLGGLSNAELHRRLARMAVLARVTPEEKVDVVRLLQQRGEIVAMAGDGINDAPALKIADVGISVGARASDLARQVSDLVMSGDDLRSILVAVGEGRIVQDNLRRALRFLCATNLSEIALVLGGSLLGTREPLGALQLLWINLLTDTLPALALALEPGDPSVLDRPPAPPGEAILGSDEQRRLVRDGLLLTGLGGAAMAVGGPSLAFACLPAAQIAYAVRCRAPRHGDPREVARTDRRFALLVGSTAAFHLASITVPALRRVLHLSGPVSWQLGGFAAGLGLPLVVQGLPTPQVIRRLGPAATLRRSRAHVASSQPLTRVIEAAATENPFQREGNP